VTASYDLVIIGGGITGLGLARLAARNGYRCVVLERGDLASGTSSASSHMLHGGIRYLEHGRFTLVRESLAERWAVHRMAPHLTRPYRFLAPLYRGDRVGPLRLRAGLWLYDRLAGPRRLSPATVLRAREVRRLEPGLEPRGLKGAGAYTDVVMDDARLAVAVARDAAAHGAEIRTYTEVIGARPAAGGGIELLAIDRLEGGEQACTAPIVVNAAGPWADHVRLMLSRALTPGSPDPEPVLRPSRGVHLVYPRLTNGHGLVISARSDGRVFFVVPFGERSLVGTTEVELPSPPPPEAWRPTFDEVAYLRAELRRVLPAAGASPIGVLSGLRPLLRSDDDAAEASREHAVIEENGVLTVAGGKYTTFRAMARDTMRRIAERLARTGRRVDDPVDPLPTPISADAGLERLAEFAVDHEFAKRLGDVLRRRSTLWLEPDRGRIAATTVSAVMARKLAWTPARVREEFQDYDSLMWEEETLLRRTQEDR
jgi:glycerol-3-phosphate dehydrogenase